MKSHIQPGNNRQNIGNDDDDDDDDDDEEEEEEHMELSMISGILGDGNIQSIFIWIYVPVRLGFPWKEMDDHDVPSTKLV